MFYATYSNTKEHLLHLIWVGLLFVGMKVPAVFGSVTGTIIRRDI